MGVFDEQISRKPNFYYWVNDFIDAMHAGHWTDKEFNFVSDIQDFKTVLSEQERNIIIRALSAIGQVECSVKLYWGLLGQNLKRPEFIDLGFVMANIEVIHGAAYERLLTVLGLEDVFEKNLELDIIKGRVNYLKKHAHKYHSDSKRQFIYSLILFTLFVENVSLFSQFYTINWFGRFKNVLANTTKMVEYTAVEETIHALVGIKLINTIRKESPELFDDELERKIIHEAKEILKYEGEIVDWMVGDFNHENLNSPLLKQLNLIRINKSLEDIGYSTIGEIESSALEKIKWFDEQTLGNRSTDFFTLRPSEYSKGDKSFEEEDLF